ncbi:MAG: glycoside hydrolase family 5 protein [Clostridiales bacterium]|jgi:endoglycosylceramidase|nr:glycoside hydrolase family 5 protein [Clostridiales bacterium]
MEKIISRGKSFYDTHGRERIFNGINVVDKEPYKPGKDSVAFADDLSWIDEFAKRGFNIIRLGTTWGVIEPSPGEYNEPALASIVKILDRCAEKGIYAFLDMHQDLYSSEINGSGDGAPKWAVLTDNLKAKPHKFVWAEPYFWGKACHRAFDNFWANKEVGGKGLLDHFADMWAHVAGTVKDHPALFGFDFLNEPFPGKDGGKVFKKLVANVVKTTLTDKRIDKLGMISDALSGKKRHKVLERYDGEILKKVGEPAHALIAEFDTKRYMPFINKTAAVVRKVTDNGIIFVGNCYYSNLGIPCSNTPVMVGGQSEEKQCFSPHGYDFAVDTPLYKYALNSRVQAIFDEHKRTQERLNVPVIVGEWGGMSDGTDWFPHVKYILDMFDKNKWSNTYWTYFDGLLNMPIMEDVLCRPYPRAVTGNITGYSYDREQDIFNLSFEQEREFDVPTEIYLHKQAAAIEADGRYEIEKSGENSAVLKVFTKPGSHTFKVTF